mmetsp:Transcript_16882/g.42928  ORF Transcript_16882/g.42928 Transcript_16882/m.42928 type:complete len:315 (+) Transcript_16882:1698-2642(+)
MARSSSFQHPLVHLIPILVLNSTESVSNSLNGVNTWTCEVIRGVSLVLSPKPWVRSVCFAPVEDWIAQALILALHVQFAAHAALEAFLGPCQHLLPELEILVHLLISSTTFDASIALLSHLVNLRVVHIGFAIFDQFLHQLLKLVEIVRGVGLLVGEDLQSAQIFLDALREFHLLLARIGVVESEDELALVVPGVVVVKHGSLGMTDVQVAAGLRGEPGAHLALHCVGQQSLQPRLILAFSAGIPSASTATGRAATTTRPLAKGEGCLQGAEVLAPAACVRVLLNIQCPGSDLGEQIKVLLRRAWLAADEGVLC